MILFLSMYIHVFVGFCGTFNLNEQPKSLEYVIQITEISK